MERRFLDIVENNGPVLRPRHDGECGKGEYVKGEWGKGEWGKAGCLSTLSVSGVKLGAQNAILLYIGFQREDGQQAQVLSCGRLPH